MSNGLNGNGLLNSSRYESINRPRERRNVMDKINSHIQELSRWSVWRAIFLGQFLSMLNMTTGVTSQLLTQRYGISVPTAQTFANYALLCVCFTSWLACRPGADGIVSALRKRGWKYVILAAFDVEANYLVVKAYNYTTLTSITLLDCFAIPTVLAMSWIFLKVRYKLLHIIGVSICLVGVGCLVWADIEEGRGAVGGQDRLVGDMLCLGGATLYGISNVGQEFVVKNFSVVEFLGMMGLFGSIINGVQLAVLERDEVLALDWSDWRVAALLGGFALAQFAFYALMPVIIRVTSATSVNLSLLTSDFFSLIAGILLFHFKFHVLYFLSFFLVMCGIVVYSSKPTPIPSQNARPYREMSAGSGSADVELNTPNTSVNEFPRSVSDVSSVPSYGTYGQQISNGDPVHPSSNRTYGQQISNGTPSQPSSNRAYGQQISNGADVQPSTSGAHVRPTSNRTFNQPSSNDFYISASSNGAYVQPCSTSAYVQPTSGGRYIQSALVSGAYADVSHRNGSTERNGCTKGGESSAHCAKCVDSSAPGRCISCDTCSGELPNGNRSEYTAVLVGSRRVPFYGACQS